MAFSGLHLDGGMAVGGWAKGAHLSKICYTYATSMKLGMFILYLKEIKKIYELRDATTWAVLTSSFFHRKSPNFAISQNTDMDFILVHKFKFF